MLHQSKKMRLDFEEDDIEIKEETTLYMNGNSDLNFQAIDTANTKCVAMMENSYLDNLKLAFEKARNEISMGQEIMNIYITFCQTRENFSPRFFEGGRRQIRYFLVV